MKKREKKKESLVSHNSSSSISFFPLDKDPDSLQNVNISVISKTECHEAYKTYNIRDSMMCVGIVPGRRLPCKLMYSQCLNFPILLCPLPER